MNHIKTFFNKLLNAYYKSPFAASISSFLVLVSFSFPVGSVIRYVLVFLAFGLFCGQSFRVRERYREETQKNCYSFVSFIPLALLLIFLLSGAVYYLILIAAGVVFLYDGVRMYIMQKRMTVDEDDNDLGGLTKP